MQLGLLSLIGRPFGTYVNGLDLLQARSVRSLSAIDTSLSPPHSLSANLGTEVALVIVYYDNRLIIGYYERFSVIM